MVAKVVLVLSLAFLPVALWAVSVSEVEEVPEIQTVEKILENAKSVPYVDPESGELKGYLVEDEKQPEMKLQKIMEGAKLSLKQGEIITGPNTEDREDQEE